MGDKCGHTYPSGMTLTPNDGLKLEQMILRPVDFALRLTEIDLVHKTGRLTKGHLFHKLTSKYSQISHKMSIMTTNLFK